MKKLFILCVFLALSGTAFAEPLFGPPLLPPPRPLLTDYYVGATTAGAGTCLTSAANNCLFATAYALVSAGDTIHMADGTYTGANSMITCSGKSGSAGNFITVQATNDGGPLIDGENARVPVFFSNCDWWHIDGLDLEDSSDAVIAVGNSSSDNKFSRITAANANPAANTHVVAVYDIGSDRNVFEDVAALGTGRKAFSTSQGPWYTTFRRVWGQFEYTENTGPKITFEGCYVSFETIIESSIIEWNQQPGTDETEFFATGIQGGGPLTPDGKCYTHSYGNIWLVRSGKTFGPGQLVISAGASEVHFTNDVMYLPSDQSSKNVISVTVVDAYEENNTLTNISLIGGDGSPTIDTEYVQTNVQQGATENDIYGAETLWVNDGTKGATICYKYQSGTLTADPLFSGASRTWPMNQRIIDVGGPDVTAWLESTFGAIPAECGDDATPPEPPVITVTNPVLGAAKPYGDTLTIIWTATGDMVGTGCICYVINGQEYTIATGVDLTDGIYTWSSNTIPVTTNAVVRVKTTAACDEDAGGAGDAQDDSAVFSSTSGVGSTF